MKKGNDSDRKRKKVREVKKIEEKRKEEKEIKL